MWIVKYIESNNSDTQVKQILDNIDHRWVTSCKSDEESF